jgi:S-DNA-T family DNA segregation ATPase FtsK/SpoIIIE
VGRNDTAAKRVEQRPPADLLNEVAALLVLAAALFTSVSLLSHQFGVGASNLGGPFGHLVSSVALEALGITSYLIPVFLVIAGARMFRFGVEGLTAGRAASAVVVLVTLCVLLGLTEGPEQIVRPGGWLGGFIASLLRDAFGTLGAVLLPLTLCVLAVMFATGSTLSSGVVTASEGARAGATRWRTYRERREKQREEARVAAAIRKPVQAPTAPARGPVIVLREDAILKPPSKPRPQAPQEPLPLPFTPDAEYHRPSLALLDAPEHDVARVDEEALRKNSEVLEAKLANFGIEGKVVAVRPGPVITTFEIEPAPGVKVNRIVTLQDDLTMALRALGVRILAPVPGKAVVGIEVANARRENVYLSEILESQAFAECTSSLTLALGKDSVGKPVAADLARMPHLLLAGATGTGKSVSLNAMIMSILFKASPRDVRFVMIDLKMLELSLYEDLPHLLVPVVTDPKKAVVVLKNLVDLMNERYRILKDKGVRNVDSYNRLIERDEADAENVIELTEVVDEGGEQATVVQHERMPKIIIIVDELADLMMTAGRQAEEPITRLAQKARACGMHLILATQRPSVDVITGLIKANFPARISFQVTARVDSRTILDCIGAERLLGSGDMLFLPPGTARVQRLHGAYVSEAEIRKVTNFVKHQGRPQYALELLEGEDEEEANGTPDEEYDDVMYDEAVRIVTETRQASISWVQRRLRVGYNRAARMVERMEREGVVSASEGGRPREVLAPKIED